MICQYKIVGDFIRKEAAVMSDTVKRIVIISMIVIAAFILGRLAMIYAYRDADEAPVSVVFTFGAVGPSSFYVEDWGIFGLDQNTEESRQAAAGLFGVMCGAELTAEEIKDGSCDKVQAFQASLRLKDTLEKNNVDYKYFELPHSGRGLQNDDKLSGQWMEEGTIGSFDDTGRDRSCSWAIRRRQACFLEHCLKRNSLSLKSSCSLFFSNALFLKIL